MVILVLLLRYKTLFKSTLTRTETRGRSQVVAPASATQSNIYEDIRWYETLIYPPRNATQNQNAGNLHVNGEAIRLDDDVNIDRVTNDAITLDNDANAVRENVEAIIIDKDANIDRVNDQAFTLDNDVSTDTEHAHSREIDVECGSDDLVEFQDSNSGSNGDNVKPIFVINSIYEMVEEAAGPQVNVETSTLDNDVNGLREDGQGSALENDDNTARESHQAFTLDNDVSTDTAHAHSREIDVECGSDDLVELQDSNSGSNGDNVKPIFVINSIYENVEEAVGPQDNGIVLSNLQGHGQDIIMSSNV